MKKIREFTIEIGDVNNPGEWGTIREAKLKAIQGCSFDLAEETIGLLEYEDGVYEVGVGECLRPYTCLYSGEIAEKASDVFIREIMKRAYVIGRIGGVR
jgi:hypothetical protein